MFKTGYYYPAGTCICMELFDELFLHAEVYRFLSGLDATVLGIGAREMLLALWPIEVATGPLEGSWKVSEAS